MVNKMFKPSLGGYEETYHLDGYVGITAAAAVVSAGSILGVVVTNTGTGEYTFTFDKCSAVRHCTATLVASTAVDLVAQVKSYSTTVIVVNLNAGATPTNPSAACGILFHATLRKTGVAR